MQLLVLAICCVFFSNFVSSFRVHNRPLKIVKCSLRQSPSNILPRSSSTQLHAIMPGSPMVVGTIAQGLANGVSLFSNVLLARFALSWFPQLPQQFPILRPIFTVSEPYLKVFRSQIPPVMGFDISAIPALFVLDILSQTIVALGAEMPAPVL